MVFYNYTIKKMIKSVSTWVTFSFAIIASWIFAITSFLKSTSNFSFYFILINFFIISLPIIFVTFQSIKVFRDEIENKTILSLQTKPITRKSMIFQGLFAIWTSIFLMLIFQIIIPGFLLGIKDDKMFLTSLTVFASYLIILLSFSAISYRLSLTFSSKSFVGLMIGVFGVGFYVLFGFSLAIKSYSSVHANTANFMNNKVAAKRYNGNIDYNYDEAKQLVTIKSMKLSDQKSISFLGEKNQEDVENSKEDVTKLYYLAKGNNKYGVYDILEWISPTSHWMRMFGAMNISNSNLPKDDFMNSMFSGKSKYIENIKKIEDKDKKIISFSFKLKDKYTVPIYYPFILWTVIGTLFIVWTLFSMKKRNIS